MLSPLTSPFISWKPYPVTPIEFQSQRAGDLYIPFLEVPQDLFKMHASRFSRYLLVKLIHLLTKVFIPKGSVLCTILIFLFPFAWWCTC